MNYYERYVGDFQRDTGHLSCAEIGVYDRFLDHYYGTEQPLPADYADLYRIARAMDKTEQKAVKRVADEFFPVAEDGLRHNQRADHEIAKAQNRINAAKENGKKGGRKPKQKPNETKTKPNGFPLGNPAETQSGVHHTPDPNTLSVEDAAASNTGSGDKTPGVLPLPAFAEQIKNLEAARGCEFSVGSPEVYATWESRGVTHADIALAHAAAVNRRVKAGSSAPVNVGLLDVILADLKRQPSSQVAAIPPLDPDELRRRELADRHAGDVLDGPDGRRFEVMANGLVSVFKGAEFMGTLGADHARAFWDDVAAGTVTPRAA